MRRFCRISLVLATALLCAAAIAGPVPEQPWADLGKDLATGDRAIRLSRASFLSNQADQLTMRLPATLRGGSPESGGLVLVQFQQGVTPERRRALLERHRALGLGYVPNHSVLARVAPRAAASLAGEAEVAWIGRFHPAYKLSPYLDSAADSQIQLDLILAPDAGALPPLRQKAQQAGAQVIDVGPTRMRVTVTSARSLALLAGFDEVLFIEPTPTLRWLNNSSRGICQSGTPGVDSIHNHGLRGAGEIVAVMDSGVDTAHCCFSGAGKIVDNRAWGGGTLGADCSGDHGTHVSGTATCSDSGSRDGLAPDAGLILQDIGKSGNCNNVFPPSPLSSAWSDALSRGAYVHTNSWGGGFNAYSGDSRAIDDFMWRNQEFLIVYAAGNEGPGEGTLGIYSNAKNSVTVGGSGNGSSRESMYGASSHGPAGDGRLLPDLTAPASGVSSARSSSACSWTSFWGTSMAAPAVAGTAALIRDYFVEGYYPTGAASAGDGFSPGAALVKATMLVSTRNMTGSGVGGSRPNHTQGFGRLTADDALWFTGDSAGERLTILDDHITSTGFSSAGEQDQYSVAVPATGVFKVMLNWTDAPGAVFAATALVNDLDLEVELENGTQFTGNQGFSSGWTTTSSSAHDRKNNKEAVFLESVAPQTITVRVRAHSLGDVALHPQDYTLILVSPAAPGGCDAPSPDGVANSVTHARSGNDLLASWADRSVDHYVVYRGLTPDFFAGGPDPYRDNVQDADAGSPGVQWSDSGALVTTTNYYYLYASANSCGEEVQ